MTNRDTARQPESHTHTHTHTHTQSYRQNLHPHDHAQIRTESPLPVPPGLTTRLPQESSGVRWSPWSHCACAEQPRTLPRPHALRSRPLRASLEPVLQSRPESERRSPGYKSQELETREGEGNCRKGSACVEPGRRYVAPPQMCWSLAFGTRRRADLQKICKACRDNQEANDLKHKGSISPSR